MQVIKKEIDGLIEIIPNIFHDSRGYFFESYNKNTFSEIGIDIEFVQDNQSVSHKNVLRGLHFQEGDFAQDKLVRVISGKALDIAVDIRKNSKTYGKWVSVMLESTKNNMFFIPKGFAHGFLSMEDNTVFSYKCSNVYNKASENGILWNDEQLAIDWQISNPIVSEKDLILTKFENLVSTF
jgi:dTDP-4-dehydrorhamnose 3,5-epimerase